MIKGQCNCGAVVYRAHCAVSQLFMCHCSICSRASGHGGVAVVVVPNEAFEWLSGGEAVATWRKPVGDWQTWFCRVCGSPVPGVNDPDHMFVPAGTITEQDEPLEVTQHMWVESKPDWFAIGDAGKQHLQGYKPD